MIYLICYVGYQEAPSWQPSCQPCPREGGTEASVPEGDQQPVLSMCRGQETSVNVTGVSRVGLRPPSLQSLDLVTPVSGQCVLMRQPYHCGVLGLEVFFHNQKKKPWEARWLALCWSRLGTQGSQWE